jgi:hypothetical protein
MPPPGPVISQSFNLAPFLPCFHGFILSCPFPGLFGTTASSKPLRVSVQYQLLHGFSGVYISANKCHNFSWLSGKVDCVLQCRHCVTQHVCISSLYARCRTVQINIMIFFFFNSL